MLKKMFRNKPSLVGLDIHPDSLRLLQLTPTRQGLRVDNFSVTPWPQRIFKDQEIFRWDILLGTLQNQVELLGLKQLPAAMACPLHLVRMQSRPRPRSFSEEACMAELSAGLQKDIPHLGEEIYLDYVPRPKKTDEVLCAATKQASLLRYITSIQNAGLKLKIVDVTLFALARAMQYVVDLKPMATAALLEVGEENSLGMIFDHQEILMHQQWSLSTPIAICQSFATLLQEKNDLKMEYIILCGSHTQLKTIHQELKKCFSKVIHPLPLFSTLTLASHIDALQLELMCSSLVTCFGLALRKIPRW